jgi:hypothetical protein
MAKSHYHALARRGHKPVPGRVFDQLVISTSISRCVHYFQRVEARSALGFPTPLNFGFRVFGLPPCAHFVQIGLKSILYAFHQTWVYLPGFMLRHFRFRSARRGLGDGLLQLRWKADEQGFLTVSRNPDKTPFSEPGCYPVICHFFPEKDPGVRTQLIHQPIDFFTKNAVCPIVFSRL